MSFNIYLISKNGKNHWVNVDTPAETFTEAFASPSAMLPWNGADELTYEDCTGIRYVHYDRIHGTDCYLERW